MAAATRKSYRFQLVGRLCLGIGAHLHLIHPLGFDTDDKAVRRAGLDYWRHVQVTEHPSEDDFWEWLGDRNVWLYSAHGTHPHTAGGFGRGDVLLFGPESVGLRSDLVDTHGALRSSL